MPKKLFVFIAIITSFLIFNRSSTGDDSIEDINSVGYYNAHSYDGIYISGNHAYVAAWYDGLRIIDISNPSHPFQVGHCPTPDAAYSVYVSGNYAYVAAAHTGGLRVIDISNPSSPFEVGDCYISGSAQGVAVSGDYAYVVGADFNVIDVSDPSSPVRVGVCSYERSAFGAVCVSGNYAYVAAWDDGLKVIDITDPSSPKEVGHYKTSGWYAYNVCISGNYAYVTDWETGVFKIIDLSNPSSLKQVGHYKASGLRFSIHGVDVSGDYAYISGDSGLKVIDISDPSRLSVVATSSHITHAQGIYVSNDYVYVTNKKSGFKIFSEYVLPYCIRGNVKNLLRKGISDVTVTLTGPEETTTVTTTDLNGHYRFTNLPPGNYMVNISKPGWRFRLPSRSYESLNSNQENQEFFGTPTFSIKGCVRDATGNEVNGVTVNLSGKSVIELSTSTSTVTMNGHFELKNLILGSYKITLSKPGWSFTPSSKNYTLLNSALDNQDFMAIPIGIEQGEVKIVGGEKGYVNPGDNEAAHIFFKPEPFGSTVNIKIYTLRGQLVWEKTMEVSGGNQEVIEWACKNAEGEAVASGIYLIYVKGAGINVRKKIAIIR